MMDDLNSDDHVQDIHHDPVYNLVKESILQSFKGMDEDLEVDYVIHSFYSGTTAEMELKKV